MTNNYSDDVNIVKTALDTVYSKKSEIVDNLTTDDSTKPLSAKQGKVLKDAIDTAGAGITVDTELSESSTNPVQNKIITGALSDKVDSADIVDSVTDSDLNPVTSNAVYDEITALKNTLTLAGVLNMATSLSLTVPVSIVYSDAFNITGALTLQKDNSGVSGQSIELLIGGTVVDTTTTDNSGGFTFTNSTVSVGSHTFQVRYNGQGELYTGSVSSTLTRTVDKETSVNTLSTGNLEADTFNGFTLTGTLLDDDGTAITGATVTVKDSNDNTLATLTTGANGAYSGDIVINTVGTYTVHTEYNGDTNYTASNSSNITITVVEAEPVVLTTTRIRSINQRTSLTAVTGRNIIADWGDGTTSTVTNSLNHTWSSTGVKTIKLYNVQSIGDSAFSGCGSLSSVSLPQATSIGDSAFSWCSSLSSVSLPQATSIGDSAFSGCGSLSSVSLPAVTSSNDCIDEDKFNTYNSNTIYYSVPLSSITYYNTAGYTNVVPLITDATITKNGTQATVTIPSSYNLTGKLVYYWTTFNIDMWIATTGDNNLGTLTNNSITFTIPTTNTAPNGYYAIVNNNNIVGVIDIDSTNNIEPT